MLCLSPSRTDLSFERRITGEGGREFPPKNDAWSKRVQHQGAWLVWLQLVASSRAARFAVSAFILNVWIPSVQVTSRNRRILAIKKFRNFLQMFLEVSWSAGCCLEKRVPGSKVRRSSIPFFGKENRIIGSKLPASFEKAAALIRGREHALPLPPYAPSRCWTRRGSRLAASSPSTPRSPSGPA